MPRRSLRLGLSLALFALSNQLMMTSAAPAGLPTISTAVAPFERPDVLSPADNPYVDTRPIRLLIGSIHLDARIEQRGLTRSHALDTALDYHNVAWYDLGPKPGDPGNALINGHVNWWTGNAVFTYLSRVRRGDLIQVVRRDGSSVQFRVTGKTIVNANARVAWLFAPSNASTLTLITCAGPWDVLARTDTERLLVSAALV